MWTKTLSLIGLLGCLTSTIVAQTELTDYLDKEVAAVAVISKPAIVYQKVIELIGFSDDEWSILKRLATDDSYGVIHPERMSAIESSFR